MHLKLVLGDFSIIFLLTTLYLITFSHFIFPNNVFFYIFMNGLFLLSFIVTIESFIKSIFSKKDKFKESDYKHKPMSKMAFFTVILINVFLFLCLLMENRFSLVSPIFKLIFQYYSFFFILFLSGITYFLISEFAKDNRTKKISKIEVEFYYLRFSFALVIMIPSLYAILALLLFYDPLIQKNDEFSFILLLLFSLFGFFVMVICLFTFLKPNSLFYFLFFGFTESTYDENLEAGIKETTQFELINKFATKPILLISGVLNTFLLFFFVLLLIFIFIN